VVEYDVKIHARLVHDDRDHGLGLDHVQKVLMDRVVVEKTTAGGSLGPLVDEAGEVEDCHSRWTRTDVSSLLCLLPLSSLKSPWHWCQPSGKL
jgi:hypothetical protein